MIGDTERREVARRLRKTHVERYNGILNGIHLGEIVGVGAQIVSPHEDQVRAAADRLADLIEPDDAQFRDAAKKVDRDALLELADEMDDLVKAWNERYPTNRIAAYSRRIREACGEEER